MQPWYIRFNVALAALLCVIVWALSLFVFHAPEGWPRGVWVAAGVALAVVYLVLFQPRRS